MTLSDEKIELVDKNRVVRVRIGVGDNGTPYLSLNDSMGRERIMLCLNGDENGCIQFRDTAGHPTLSMGVSSEFGPLMGILDYQNETTFTINTTNHTGRIRLETKEGVYTWPAPGAIPKVREAIDDETTESR